MKTILLSLVLSLFVFSGCATWKGLKKDSRNAWEVTKDTSAKAYNSSKDIFINRTN